jgi:hypothetical protein
MKASFVTSILRGTALVAMAAFATVATTANAQAVTAPGSGPGGGTSGELGYNIYTLGTNGGTTGNAYWNVTTGSIPASDGYNFIYASGNPSAPGQYGAVVMQGLPAGGPFLALDGDYDTTGSSNPVRVATDVTGLTVGTSYTLTYYAADDQQEGYVGNTYDAVTACVDTTCKVDSTANGGLGVEDADHGCSKSNISCQTTTPNDTPFVEYQVSFVADAGTELLTFLDNGTPATNAPAFALIDDISVAPTTPPGVPEPSSLLLMSTGLIGIGGLLRSRFKKSETAA